jgi:coenzyme F420-reducing hydrogenase delta subunit
MKPPKVILLTCNWKAYSGLETAGAQRLIYPAGVLPLKQTCLGQVSTGMILKAFEKGADGVLLLGCPPEECHYDFGNRRVESVVAEARDLLEVMGIREAQLGLDWISAGDGSGLVQKVNAFVAGLNGTGGRE